MASTPLGDIPNARFHEAFAATNASVASGGANALVGMLGPFAHAIRPRNAWWIATGASNAGGAGSYRQLTLLNGGTSGTATAQTLASYNATASAASQLPNAMTVDTTQTVASGNVLVFSQATVGGIQASSTLAAGQFAFDFEVIG